MFTTIVTSLASVSATLSQTGRVALFDFPDLAHKICTKLGECHYGLYQEVSGHAHKCLSIDCLCYAALSAQVQAAIE